MSHVGQQSSQIVSDEESSHNLHDPPPSASIRGKSLYQELTNMSSTASSEGNLRGGFINNDTKVYYLKHYRQFWASGPAAAVAVIAGSPLENVKTRMQSKHFASAWQATKYVFQNEGIRGFWNGTTAPMMALTVNRAVAFGIYRKAKYAVDEIVEKATGVSPLQHVNTAGTYPNIFTLACFVSAGMVQGALLTPVLVPFEVLKNASQTAHVMSDSRSGTKKRVTTFSAAKQIIRSHGVMSLWKGFNLHLLRDTIGGGVYFGVYESVKQALGSYYGDEMKNTPWAIPLAGATCGIASWIVTYPFDTMKTRAQSTLLSPTIPVERTVTSGSATTAASGIAASSYMRAANAAAASASKAGRWRGIEMVILRSALQNMIQMTAFEQVKVYIDKQRFDNGDLERPGIKRELGRERRLMELKEDEPKDL